jgi:hypothetical protein
MEKGRRNIKEPTHVFTAKFDIWENQNVLFAKLEHLVFTVMRWSIFLNGDQFYIFHKLHHVGMFFHIMHTFLDNLFEFHLRNK